MYEQTRGIETDWGKAASRLRWWC